MRTTATIVAALTAERDEHMAAGRLVDAKAAIQKITAHETVSRLRAELAAHPDRDDPVVAGRYTQQINSWLGYVNTDVDPQPEAGGQDGGSTSDVGPLAAPGGRRAK